MLQQTPPPEKPSGRRFLPSRRAFLVGTGALVGLTVAFAFWPRRWPNARVPADGETLLNAWISVSPEGRVTVAVPQAEMGQGIWSGFAQVVADEMGADWRQVGVEPAPWHPAFAHVGLATLGTSALPPMLREIAGHLGVTAIQRLNLHMTGGSTSMTGFHDSLRAGAAAARTLLVEAAARDWGANPRDTRTENGVIIHQANRMGFGAAATLVDPEGEPADVVLRDPAARPLEGRRMPRLDLPAKVDGTARFGGDVRLPGMLYAAIRHGPVGSRLVGATAPEGVTLVKGPAWVATVGVTTFDAMRALDRVKPDFRIEGRTADSWIGEAVVARAGGAAAPAGGKRLVADYAVPFLAHAAMEPMVAVARVADGRAEIWGPTQSLTLAHWAVAEALGIETNAVTVHPTLVGGGFGRKAEADAMGEAALIANTIGRPVLLQWSREEDLAAGRFRPPAAARMEAVLGEDGSITDWKARIAVPSVSASFAARVMPRFAPDPANPSDGAIEGAAEIPYAVGAFAAEHVPIVQPVPLGFWRSVGHSFSAFFVESFVDELAAEAGQDPLAFRLRLLEGKPRHQRVLKAAADSGQWTAALPAGIGRGIALHESFGSIVAIAIEAGAADGGIRIRRMASAIDCGRAINPDSVRAQVEGGALMGLSAALGEGMTFAGGVAEARNFDTYPLLAMRQAPEVVTTTIITSGAALGGVGEPGTPPAAPALANALFAATGKRARILPLLAQFL
jgi:isoquinoline 1-oxidoreductase beta subunit